MVEGPEYRRHAELLQVLVGQRLLRVHKAHRLLAQALAEFVGLRVLRVLSVGKEIFVIFESRAQIEVEDGALRMHLGESGGYVITPKITTSSASRAICSADNANSKEGSSACLGRSWGPKAVKDSRNPNGQPPPETELQFSEAWCSLWDSLGSRYQVCPWSYVSTVEGRLQRDVSFDIFDFQEAAHLIRNSGMLLVDAVMNQAILPGVGNIIKNEGLFRSRLHPLRKSSSLTEDEVGRLLVALCDFSSKWFDNCRRSPDGAHMGCSLPLCYGRSSCTSCNLPITLIKEGERKRLTFMCSACQTPDTHALTFLSRIRRTHRLELPVKLPRCKCGDLPVLQLFRKPGRHFGRLHAICWKRKHVNQPGCAGQHRRSLHGPKSGCNYLVWLDGSSSKLSPTNLPTCICGHRPTLRRAMTLRDNGQIFARCTSSTCRWRLWLRPVETASHGCDEGVTTNPKETSKIGADTCAIEFNPSVPVRLGRWRQRYSHDAIENATSSLAGYAQPLTKSACPPNWLRSARLKERCTSWSVGDVLHSVDVPVEDSDDPLTSGEELVGDEAEEYRGKMQLPSLEESWTRLRSAKPMEAPPPFQKRWRVNVARSGPAVRTEPEVLEVGDLVAIPSSTLGEVLFVTQECALETEFFKQIGGDYVV